MTVRSAIPQPPRQHSVASAIVVAIFAVLDGSLEAAAQTTSSPEPNAIFARARDTATSDACTNRVEYEIVVDLDVDRR